MRWRSPGPDFAVTSELEEDRIVDAFRFGDTEDWYRFEGLATSSTALTPRVQVSVSVPTRRLAPSQALRLANKVNRHGLCCVHFDEDAGVLLIQQSNVFTGYHDEPAEAESGIRRAQCEAAANMFAGVLHTVGVCVLARDALAPS